MEPLKSLQSSQTTANGRKESAGAAAASSTLSPLASFAKQKEVVLGSPVARKPAPPLTPGASGKPLSGLASFAKSQQLQQQPSEPLKLAQTSGPLGVNLSKESPLAAFAKSIVPSASGKEENVVGALHVGAAPARPGLTRLNSTSKPAAVVKSLEPLLLLESPAPIVEEDATPTETTESQAKESVYHDSDSSRVKQTGESEAKESGAAESSDGFSDMDEANILHSDEEDDDDADSDCCDAKEASSREAKSQLDAREAEAELYASRDRGVQPKYVAHSSLSKARSPVLTLLTCTIHAS